MARKTLDDRHANPSSAAKEPEFRHGLPFVGGRLWLDLVNTTPLDPRGVPIDLVGTDDGLRTWLAAARLAAIDTPVSADLHQRMLALRANLRVAFADLRADGHVSEPTIAAINQLLDSVSIRSKIERDGDGVRLVHSLEPGAAGAAGVIAEDFARFSCDFEPERLKHCANPGCSMVFFDIGKNNVRRWCSMTVCGNRDKVARFRAKQAGSATQRT